MKGRVVNLMLNATLHFALALVSPAALSLRIVLVNISVCADIRAGNT